MTTSKPVLTEKETAVTQSLAELKEAARLVEKAAFELAEVAPSDLIADLIVAVADIERVMEAVAQGRALVN